MGAYAPVAGIADAQITELTEAVHVPVLRELERRGSPFVGLLYAGLMVTDDGPRVLEFNCRFGDPETQAVLPLLEGDLLAALAGASMGDLAGVRLETTDVAAVTVVLAAGGYPAAGDRGRTISGVYEAEAQGALVFHAGTALHGDRLVTNGGRILAVTGRGETVASARARAYDAVGRIEFPEMRCRSDIAEAAAAGAAVRLQAASHGL
jgi:phosphoribosylamine--glycine ligase